MKNKEIDLSNYHIVGQKKIFHNISYDDLYKHETAPTLRDYELAYHTSTGALSVNTGIFTGRSPKDKYIVKDSETEQNIWWATSDRKTSDNKPISKEIWKDLLKISQEQLSNKDLYVTDAYCGANSNTRIKIRVISEVAWQAHFVKNMFIRPTEEELIDFEPDFVMLMASKAINYKWKEHGLNSEVYIAFNITDKIAVVGGTWYGGEIKKGFFSIMNYLLPLQGIASMHCSANQGKDGSTALFFGLSGTGKTTLSTDKDRLLIGDDEHGWDDEGIFNFEGGCYAKCIRLNQEQEPDIYKAIRRDALLENVVIKDNGDIDFYDESRTENTRVSYPIYHINNIVKPISKGRHPKNILFLTADAFGILPPIAKLTEEQAMYYFLSGYTAKLAGTERGIKEPTPTFSSAFGGPFLLLHPTKYASELSKKIKQHKSSVYLINTGWTGGCYGVGNRIEISITRTLINAIHSGEINQCEFTQIKPFGLWIPKALKGVDPFLLNPRNTWSDKEAYDKKAKELAQAFINNFKTFTDTEEGMRLVATGPCC